MDIEHMTTALYELVYLDLSPEIRLTCNKRRAGDVAHRFLVRKYKKPTTDEREKKQTEHKLSKKSNKKKKKPPVNDKRHYPNVIESQI